MGHIKYVDPDSWNFGEPQCEFIKTSAHGVVGKDLAELKSRSHPRIAEALRKLAFRPGEVPIHLIALGAFEYFSCNKNGDGFRKRALQERHDTFVKHAMFFRDHKSEDKLKSYGRPVWSTYYEPMHRVELIVALNGTKEAAERNRGMVADRELEKLASGKPLVVSMGASVPVDECSACHNKARHRREYCRGVNEGGKCPGGGLTNKMGQIVKLAGSAHHLHADNPDPDFFDISAVVRQADRVAYVLGELHKAAADGRTTGGSTLLEMVEPSLPSYLSIGDDAWVDTAVKLAAWERRMQSDPALYVRYALPAGSHPSAPQRLGSLDKLGDWLKGVTTAGSVVPLPVFLDSICESTGRESLPPAAKTAVQREMVGIFDRNSAENTWTEIFSERILDRVTNSPAVSGRNWGEKYAEAYGFHPRALQSRVGRHLLSATRLSCFPKQAACDPAASALARAYACYQVQALSSWSPEDTDRALPYVIAQNWTAANTQGV